MNMIAQDKVTIGNKEFIYTHSTDGYFIKQLETGDLYAEAYDLVDSIKHYEETDKKIDDEEL